MDETASFFFCCDVSLSGARRARDGTTAAMTCDRPVPRSPISPEPPLAEKGAHTLARFAGPACPACLLCVHACMRTRVLALGACGPSCTCLPACTCACVGARAKVCACLCAHGHSALGLCACPHTRPGTLPGLLFVDSDFSPLLSAVGAVALLLAMAFPLILRSISASQSANG